MTAWQRKTPRPLVLEAWVAVDCDGDQEHVLGVSLSKSSAAAQAARVGGGFLIGGRFVETVAPAPEGTEVPE